MQGLCCEVPRKLVTWDACWHLRQRRTKTESATSSPANRWTRFAKLLKVAPIAQQHPLLRRCARGCRNLSSPMFSIGTSAGAPIPAAGANPADVSSWTAGAPIPASGTDPEHPPFLGDSDARKSSQAQAQWAPGATPHGGFQSRRLLRFQSCESPMLTTTCC